MRGRLVIVALAAALASLSAVPVAGALTPAGAGPWFWQAPQPFGTRLGAVELADAQHVWATAEDGFMLSSDDAGLTWERRQIAPDTTFFDALQFLDAGHGFAVGADVSGAALKPAAVKTTDGGASWVDMTPAASGMFTGVSFADEQHGWLVQFDMKGFFVWTGSVLATSDGGASWRTLPIATGVVPECVELADPLHGHVGDTDGRVWSTADGGAHWHRSDLSVAGMSSSVTGVEFADSLRGWAVASDVTDDGDRSRVFATGDGGITWRRLRTVAAGCVSDVRDTGGRVYLAGTMESGPAFVDVSDDRGLTWTRHWIGRYDLELSGIDVAGDTCLAVGTEILRSTDGGSTWKSFTSGTRASLADGVMASATDGWAVGRGVVLHTSDGARWSDQWNGSRDLSSVSFPDVANGWAVGERGLVLHTANGGQAWERQSAGTNLDLYEVDFPDAEHGWAVIDSTDSPHLLALRTVDGGATWTKVKVGFDVCTDAICFLDDRQGWIAGVVGSSYGVLRTTDGGSTWTAQKLPGMDYIFDVFFLNSTEGWIAGGTCDDDGFCHAFLVHTSDGGVTWGRLPDNEVPDTLFHSCYFVDSLRGWAAGDGGLFSTTDGGRTWTQEGPGGGWSPIDVTGVDAGHAWAFGDSRILSSFDVAGDTAAPATLNDGDLLWHRTPVTVRLSANDTGGSGLLRTEYRVDDDPVWHEGDVVGFNAPADHSGDGRHVLHYRSLDVAGNIELTQRTVVPIDTRRPRPVARWAAGVRRGYRASLRYYIGDRCRGTTETVAIKLMNARGRVVRRATLHDVTPNKPHLYRFVCRLPRGTYRFRVYATDAAGNRQTRVAVNRLIVR